MAILRMRSHLTSSSSSPAPPPSPIPTAKGSRSAAINDHILSEFLDKSLQIPNLSLPESQFRASTLRPTPADVDFGSLKTRGDDTISRLLKSSKEFGVLRIIGHGISAEELRSVAVEAESVFRVSEGTRRRFSRNYREIIGKREEFIWLLSEEKMLEWAQEVIGGERYRSLSKKMVEIGSELHEIAELLGMVLSENTGGRAQNRLEEKEPVLSLYRYTHDNPMDDDFSLLRNERNRESGRHALKLHLPIQHCEFRIQSRQESISFHAGPGSIVVTVGEELEEWSRGEFKSVSAALIFDPEPHGRQASFSIGFNCPSLNLSAGLNKITKGCVCGRCEYISCKNEDQATGTGPKHVQHLITEENNLYYSQAQNPRVVLGVPLVDSIGTFQNPPQLLGAARFVHEPITTLHQRAPT